MNMRQFEVRVVDAKSAAYPVLDYDAGPDGRAQAEMDLAAWRRGVRGTPFARGASDPKLELRETGTEEWLDPETFDTLARAEREGRKTLQAAEPESAPSPGSAAAEIAELNAILDAGPPPEEWSPTEELTMIALALKNQNVVEIPSEATPERGVELLIEALYRMRAA